MNDRVPDSFVNLSIPCIERGARLLPSLSQQRLWFASQVGESGLEFIFPYALRLHGKLDRNALKAAINTIVDRHEVLRTNFVSQDGEPFQIIRDDFSFDLEVEQIEAQDEVGREEELAAALKRAVEIAFDLESDLMLRAHLFQLQPEHHVLLLVVHHIATDGWSMDVFFREMSLVYNAVRAGLEPELPHLPVQFVDVAQWEREAVERGDMEEDMQYWREHLSGAPQVLTLPLDKKRPTVQTFEGAWVKFSLPAETVTAMHELAKGCRATQFHILLAAYQVVLARWQGRNDIIVGTPAANRLLPETEVLIGFFMNLLPLRGLIDENESFLQLVGRTRATVIDGFDHQGLSFDRLVAELSPERTLAQNPMLQTTLAMESNLPVLLNGLRVEVVEARPNVARYDVAFDYWPDAGTGGLNFDAYYASDIFERSTIETLVERFKFFIHTACTQPEARLALIPATSPNELAQILAFGEGEDLRVKFSAIHTRFSACVDATPNAVAVTDGGREFSFADIRAISDLIATNLGVIKTDEIIAVCLPRCSEWVGVTLGVLNAGAAYLPLDPEYPLERLRYMLQDSGARTVITSAAFADSLPKIDGIEFQIVSETLLQDARKTQRPLAARVVRPAQLAYVIYTSGSTGHPKGVAVSHGALAGFMASLEQSGAVRSTRATVGWNASASFDASVQQWVRVCRGDALVIVQEDIRRDPLRMVDLCISGQFTDLDLTPSQAEPVLEELLKRGACKQPLRLWVGGETISSQLWQRLACNTGNIDAINVYGLTETTVDTTWARVDALLPPNIGKPLPTNQVYVLDEKMRIVPVGVEGELYIGGPSLARGYLGRSGLTAQRFIPNPISSEAGARMYRTGDRARWRADGNLEFLGRADQQVKIRGFRVELTEVETALQVLPEVLECAVVRRDDERGVALLAFVRGNIDIEQLRNHAESTLPAWMCPSGYILVEKMPKTPSGKLDREALAGSKVTGLEGQRRNDSAKARPMSAVEELIASIWCEILQLDSVAIGDNFFHLGGHSLLAIKMIARIKRKAQLTLSMTTIFEKPVLADFSSVIEQMIRNRLAVEQDAPK